MKLIPHHLWRLPNVLENPSISLSPHNPKERERRDPPKSFALNKIPKTLEESHQYIANTTRLNSLHPSLRKDSMSQS